MIKNFKSTTKIFLFSLLIFLALHAHVWASEPLKVGIFQNKPVVYFENGPKGLFVEVLDYVVQKENWEMEYVVCELKDCLRLLKSNELDLIASLGESPERIEHFAFSKEAIWTFWGTIYSHDKRIQSVFDLKGKKIGVRRKNKTTAELRALLSEFNIPVVYIEFDNYEAAYESFKNRNFDVIAVNNTYGFDKQKEISAYKTPIVFSPFSAYFAASKKGGHANRLNVIDKYVKLLKEDQNSLLHTFNLKWFALHERFWDAKLIGIISTVGLLIAVFVFAFWRYLSLVSINKELEENITERRQIEQILLESEKKFRAIADTSPLAIYMSEGIEQKAVYINPTFTNLFGYTIDDVPTVDHWWPLAYPDADYREQIATEWQLKVKTAIDKKSEIEPMEVVVTCKDGTQKNISWGYITIGKENWAFGLDLTERKRSEIAQQAHIQLLTSMEIIDQIVRSATDLDQMMRHVLDAVLSILDCDRAWLLYPADPDSPYWRVPMERTVPEYPLSEVLNSELPMQPWILKILKRVVASRGAVKLGPGEKTPVPSEGRDQFQIQSIIAMAVYPKGDKPWVFGLHQCSFARIWSDNETTLFQEIGRRIADALTNLLAFRNLQKSEVRFRTLVENIPGFVYRSELKAPWRLQYVSEAALDLTGYSARQFLEAQTVNFGELILAEDMAAVEPIVADCVSKGSHYELEYRIRHASGEVRWVNEKGRAIYDEDGVPLWLDGVIIDITERKQTNEALKKNEATLRSIYESSPMLMGIVELTVDNKIVHIYDNPATARFFNIEYRGTKNRTADELGAPSEAIQEWLVGYRKSQQQGKPAQFEYVHPTPDGPRWLSATVSLIGPNKDRRKDRRTRFSYVAEDITDRKRTDEALRTSEAFLNAILDQSPFSTWVSDDKGTLIKLNEACRKLLNITEADVVGKYNVFQDNIVKEQGFMPLIRRVFEAGEATEFELRYDSSQLSHLQLSGFVSVIVDITIFPIKDQNGKITNAVFQQIDITAQRKAEYLLYENEERLRQAVRFSNIGIFDHDHLTGAFYSSPEHLKIYRLNATSTLAEFINLTHPEDQDLVGAAVQRAHDPGGNGKFDIEFRLLLPGGEIRWVAIRSQTFFAGENGARHSIRTIGAVQDISDQKQAEIIMQEYADRQKVLLSEVNHRVKNNLAVIIGMLHKEEDRAKQKRQTSFLPLLHDLEGRLKGLLTVHSMLASTNWQPLLLSGLCKRIVSGIMKPYTADISIHISDSKTMVKSDQAHHLALVINELATNSLKYAISEPVRTCVNIDIKENAGRVFLVFRDNGPGYPDSIINGENAGMSLGFDLITGIVKKSLHGTLSFRNQNGAVAEISFDKS